MEYLSLFKKYVMTSDSECKKLYNERFNSENSFHLSLNIGRHEAFFYAHPSIYEKVCTIYKQNDEVISSFSLLPPVAQEHYIKRCLIDEIQFSNEIEGVISTRKEISDIIDAYKNNKKVKKDRFEGIVNSYIKLRNKENFPLNTPSDIRKIYDDLLLKEIILENPKNAPDGIIFRNEQVEVDNLEGKAIHHGVYPEREIINYLDYSLNFLNNFDLDPIIKISIFHYLFGYIHPFYDGNGRINRFISSYLLSKILCPITSFRISMTIKENSSLYYKAFQETNDVRNFGDIGVFVDAMLNIIIESQKNTISFAKEQLNTIDFYMKKIEAKVNSKKEKDFIFVLLQASLFSSDGLSMVDLCQILKMDNKTISNYSEKYSSFVSINTSSKSYLYSIDVNKID